MHLKVQGGTTRGDQSSLCLSCKKSTVIKGQSMKYTRIHCNAVEKVISFDVVECSAHVNRNHPSLGDMYEDAWVLRTDSKTRKIGFVRNKDLDSKERFYAGPE